MFLFEVLNYFVTSTISVSKPSAKSRALTLTLAQESKLTLN